MLFTYMVAYGSRILGSTDATYVLAESEAEAIDKASKVLDRHKLIPDFLNRYSQLSVTRVGN